MRLLDAFFALRPMVLVPAWSFFLLGRAAVREDGPFPAPIALLFTLAMVGVHLVNQIADRETDRINDKAFFLQRGVFRVRDYVTWAALCLVTCVAATAGGAVGLRAAALLLAAIAIGLAYSLRPLRLAGRPGLDLVANASGYGVVAPLLGAGGAGLHPSFLGAAALAVGAVFLHTTLLDLEGDARTGKRTSGVVFGVRATRALAAACSAGAALLAFTTPHWMLRVPCLVLGVVAAAAWLGPKGVGSRTVCVLGTALFALAAGWTWPPFLAGLVLLAVGCRIYYARRFGIRYPAL